MRLLAPLAPLVLTAGAALADCERLSETVEFCATPTIWGLETPDFDFAEGAGLSYPEATPSLYVAPFDLGPLLPPLDGDPEAVFAQLDLVLGYVNSGGDEVILRDRFLGPDVPAYTVGMRDGLTGRTSLQSVYELGGATWLVYTAVPWARDDPGHLLAHGQALRALSLIEGETDAGGAAETCATLTPPLVYCAPAADGPVDAPEAPFVNFDGSEQWNLLIGDVFEGDRITVIVQAGPSEDSMPWPERMIGVFERTGSADVRILPEGESHAALRARLGGLGIDRVTQIAHVAPYETFQDYSVLSLAEGAQVRVRIETRVSGPLTDPGSFQVPGIGMLRPEADAALALHRRAVAGLHLDCETAEDCAAAIAPLRARAEDQ